MTLQPAAGTRLAAHSVLSVALAPRVMTSGALDYRLGLRRRHTVLRDVVAIPGVPPELHGLIMNKAPSPSKRGPALWKSVVGFGPARLPDRPRAGLDCNRRSQRRLCSAVSGE